MDHAQKADLLFVLSHAPLGGTLARESLDAVMTAALLNQTVSLLFLADGVHQLRQEEFVKQLESLMELAPMSIYANEDDLQARNLGEAQLAVTQLKNEQVQSLFKRHTQILSF
jgi:tRNA 2-thiouridine synthesizing protein C